MCNNNLPRSRVCYYILNVLLYYPIKVEVQFSDFLIMWELKNAGVCRTNLLGRPGPALSLSPLWQVSCHPIIPSLRQDKSAVGGAAPDDPLRLLKVILPEWGEMRTRMGLSRHNAQT